MSGAQEFVGILRPPLLQSGDNVSVAPIPTQKAGLVVLKVRPAEVGQGL